MNLEVVKDYYGKVLKRSEDLKTSACCDGGDVPSHLEALLANVHEEVRAKYYGCGIVVPAALSGPGLWFGPRRLSHRAVGWPGRRSRRCRHDRRAAGDSEGLYRLAHAAV